MDNCLDQMPEFEWFVVEFGSKNEHQQDIRFKGDWIRAQNLLPYPGFTLMKENLYDKLRGESALS